MPTTLLGLGSNLGDSEATLRMPSPRSPSCPTCRSSGKAIGTAPGQSAALLDQPDYLNGAAVVETKIRATHLVGRTATNRGPARSRAHRTLGTADARYRHFALRQRSRETQMLVLAASANDLSRICIATRSGNRAADAASGHWLADRTASSSSAIGQRLAGDRVAQRTAASAARQLAHRTACSPIDRSSAICNGRSSLAAALDDVVGAAISINRTATAATATKGELPYAAAAFPKLSVLLDADVAHRGADKLQWSTLVRQPGRGPTLRLQTADPQEIEAELLAAVDAVWA